MAKKPNGNAAPAAVAQPNNTGDGVVAEPVDSASTVPLLDASAEAAAVLDNAPEVSQHVVSQASAVSAVPPAASGVSPASFPGSTAQPSVDGWDPKLHAVGRDGKGVRNADGSWKKKRQPRASVSPTGVVPRGSVGGNAGQSVSVLGQPAAFNPERARASGVMAGRATLQMMSMFGTEWKADRDEEAMLTQSMGDYFVAKQMQDFPPGVALCMVFGTFVVRRFGMPKTQSGLQRLKLRFAVWMVRRKLKKMGKANARVEVIDGEIHITEDKPLAG